MESVQQRAAVQLTVPDVGVFQIPIVRCRVGAVSQSSTDARAVASRSAISTYGAWSSGVWSTIRDHFARRVRVCGGLLKADTLGCSIARLGFRLRVILGIRGRSRIPG
jgi:hypothetical protein